MNGKAPPWLLLITNLPGRNPTLRMRIWRGLKSAGAGLLRDGVYVMPNSNSARSVFDNHSAEIKAAGGFAQILAFNAENGTQSATLMALFDRATDYSEAIRSLETFKRDLAKLKELDARQRLAAIGRHVATIAARDFFPGPGLKQVKGGLSDAEAALNRRFVPDEPRVAQQKIRIRDRKTYRGRTWATRERLWIDRVASAWLIRRFIDPAAKFVWLKRVKDCPKRAVGFTSMARTLLMSTRKSPLKCSLRVSAWNPIPP